MNELDMIKLNIFEAYDNGEISYGEKEYLLEQVDYMYEKHVPPKRRRENQQRRNKLNRKHFEQKYKYDPNTKTIELDGKRVPAELDSYTTGMDPNDNTLHTDKIFYRNLSPQKRKAIIDHEIGHGKLQSFNNTSPLHDESFTTKQGVYAATLNGHKNANQSSSTILGINASNKRVKKNIQNDVKKTLKDMNYNDKDSKTQKQLTRDEILRKLSKHENNKEAHANRAEFEADLYASQQQKTGKGQLIKGVKEYQKQKYDDMHRVALQNKAYKRNGEFDEQRFRNKMIKSAKDAGFDPNENYYKNLIDDQVNVLKKTNRSNTLKGITNQKKNSDIDIRAREKALNDKSITDKEKSIYKKESTFDLLLESINDLYYDEY